MDRTRPVIYYLIGSPGAGKYTISQEVARLTGARLVDNHAISNVIFNVLDVDGIRPLPDGVWGHVGKVRQAVMDALQTISPPHLSFIFTNFLIGENPKEKAIFDEMADLAMKRESLFVPVLVRCDTAELRTRITSESRRQRMKLIDPERGAYYNDEVPRFETDHPNTLRLDVTEMPAAESAQRIVEWAALQSSAQS